MKKRESGIALITAVLIVAMASIAAVAMTENFQLSIHRTTNLLFADQRYLYTLGSEAWARGQLNRDIEENHPYDGLNEDWAKELPLTVLEEGRVAAQTTDLQGRFNLNNLYMEREASEDVKQRTAKQIEIFRRLLNLLELNEAIAQAAADFIDQDIDPQYPDGAEDNLYLGMTPPYRTANTLFAHPSELMLVNGVTAEDYAKLRPYITALPAFTLVNVNTASNMVIRALIPAADEAIVTKVLSDRETKPFESVQTFIDRLKAEFVDNVGAIAGIETLIAVTSDYYLLQTVVRIDETNQYLSSLLLKTGRSVSVLSRDFDIY